MKNLILKLNRAVLIQTIVFGISLVIVYTVIIQILDSNIYSR